MPLAVLFFKSTPANFHVATPKEQMSTRSCETLKASIEKMSGVVELLVVLQANESARKMSFEML